MTGFGIFLIVCLAFWALWGPISRWFSRKAQDKMEDYLRSQMGMPPREGSRKAKKWHKQQQKEEEENRRRYERERRERWKHEFAGILRIYAEDVEYEEIEIKIKKKDGSL